MQNGAQRRREACGGLWKEGRGRRSGWLRYARDGMSVCRSVWCVGFVGCVWLAARRGCSRALSGGVWRGGDGIACACRVHPGAGLRGFTRCSLHRAPVQVRRFRLPLPVVSRAAAPSQLAMSFSMRGQSTIVALPAAFWIRTVSATLLPPSGASATLPSLLLPPLKNVA